MNTETLCAVFRHRDPFSDETRAMLQSLCNPVGQNGPVALSFTFQTTSYRTIGYSVDGSLVRQGGTFRRIDYPCSERDPAAAVLCQKLWSDRRLLRSIDTCQLRFCEEDIELREAQAYLTPDSVTVLNVPSRDQSRAKGGIKGKHSVHLLRATSSAHEEIAFQEELGELYRCLRFLSDPKADNRNARKEILRRVAHGSRPRPIGQCESDNLKLGMMKRAFEWDRPTSLEALR